MAQLDREFSVPSILVEYEPTDDRPDDDDPQNPPSSRNNARRSRRARSLRAHQQTNHSQDPHDETTEEPMMGDESSSLEGSPKGSPTHHHQLQKHCDHQSSHLGSNKKSEVDGFVSGFSRLKNLSKMKLLVRSHALREAASPPPELPSQAAASPNGSIAADQDFPTQGHCQDRQEELEGPVIENDNDAPSSHQDDPSNRLGTCSSLGEHAPQFSMDSSTSFNSFSMSLDSSTELLSNGAAGSTGASHFYTDNTGVDLHQFIVDTLHRNYKDRMTLLRIEQDMVALARDSHRTCHRFPAMSSYHRMLVHRVAAYFGMEHNVDQSGNCVVVSKSQHTRLPQIAFKHYVRDDIILPEEPNKKSSLKRDVVSFEDVQASGRHHRPSEARSRSFECSELSAESVASRTFESQMAWNSFHHGGTEKILPTATTPTLIVAGAPRETVIPSSYSVTSENDGTQHGSLRCPRRLVHGAYRTSRVPKVESFDSRELSCNYGSSLRPAVAKSYSFGGYTAACTGTGELALMRDQSALNRAYPPHQLQCQIQMCNSRYLSKQDSNSSSVSRSSPTSSGYKSQQSLSVSAAPSPTPLSNGRMTSRCHPVTSCSIESQSSIQEWTKDQDRTNCGGCSPQHQSAEGVADAVSPARSACNNSTTVLWAVTSLNAVPPGSMLINPQTGQPFYDQDGTPYRYDPHQPLPSFVVEASSNYQSVNGGVKEIDDSFEPSQEEDKEDLVPPNRQEEPVEASGVSSVPYVYSTWPQNYYHTQCASTSVPTLTSTHQNSTGQQYYEYSNSNPAQPSGFIIGHHPSSSANVEVADEALKTNCVAIPVGHGQGYVLYQACIAPTNDSASNVTVESTGSDLNHAFQNLTLRPVNDPAGIHLAYPSIGVNGTGQQRFRMVQNPPVMTTVPLRPVNGYNPVQNETRIYHSSTPPSFSNSTTSMPSNSYLASVPRMPATQVTMQPYGSSANLSTPAYHPMVYSPSMATGLQSNSPHYVPTGFAAHQYDNTMYVSSPRPIAVPVDPGTNGCSLGMDMMATTNPVDMQPVNRVAIPTSSISSSRFPCVYEATNLPSSTGNLAGQLNGFRPSSVLVSHPSSLPAQTSTALYNPRPRSQCQQQFTFAGPPRQRPATPPFSHPGQGGVTFLMRPSRTRRQTVRSQGTGPTVASTSTSILTTTPSISTPTSSIQQFPTN